MFLYLNIFFQAISFDLSDEGHVGKEDEEGGAARRHGLAEKGLDERLASNAAGEGIEGNDDEARNGQPALGPCSHIGVVKGEEAVVGWIAEPSAQVHHAAAMSAVGAEPLEAGACRNEDHEPPAFERGALADGV